MENLNFGTFNFARIDVQMIRSEWYILFYRSFNFLSDYYENNVNQSEWSEYLRLKIFGYYSQLRLG